MTNDEIIDNNAVKLLHNIVKEAKSDGVLTDDEKDIIKEIERHLWDVENDVEVMLEAGEKSTPEIMDEIREMLQEVLKKAEEVANADGQITADEKSLLDTLSNFIHSDNVSGLLSEYLEMFV